MLCATSTIARRFNPTAMPKFCQAVSSSSSRSCLRNLGVVATAGNKSLRCFSSDVSRTPDPEKVPVYEKHDTSHITPNVAKVNEKPDNVYKMGALQRKVARDLVDNWTRGWFIGTAALANVASIGGFLMHELSPIWIIPALGYTFIGVRDMNQPRRTLLRNFPVLHTSVVM